MKEGFLPTYMNLYVFILQDYPLKREEGIRDARRKWPAVQLSQLS